MRSWLVVSDVNGSNKQAEERRAAFAGLAREQQAGLLRAAHRMCLGDDDRAQDLVQDTLVRAYDAYRTGRFHDGTNPRPWLMRILTNLFINDYNHRKRWDAGIDVETLTSGGDAGPAQTHVAAADLPGAQLMESVLDEELEAALAQLSPPLRLCILLVDVEGMDYAEAATVLDVPIGTVRSRLARARMRLEDLLTDWARCHRLR